ncbi:ATP-binding protein [Mycetocola lacteus]|uniref:ATP-binding protein n=1 Tax=Mycetocola lacteus TaxID=76637 RepID=UPI001FECF785|nr:ATP-binding protein [Mycetocola lacteus]
MVEVEASKYSDEAFRRTLASKIKSTLFQLSPRIRWTKRFQRAASALSAFALSVNDSGTWTLGWDIPASAGIADYGDLALDLTDVLVELGEAAKEASRGVVLSIDEVQFLKKPQLEALIQAIHKTVQRRLPITLVGAGLPQIAELAGDAKSYAERLFKFPSIGSLSEQDSREAISGPARAEGIGWEPDALEFALSITKGYPYFIQEFAHQTWEIAPGDSITLMDAQMAVDPYEAKLDSSFFRVRLDRATPLQTAYMRAMAQLGSLPQKAADVAGLMGRESTQVAPTRAELIDMGLLYTPEHGYAAFTVPDFDKYIMRAVPTLVVPQIRRRTRHSDSRR